MFHCPIYKNFQLSRSKVSYVISDGLGPYFQKQLIYENSSKNPVTLHYDETTTTQVIKQMDLHFLFWSEEQNEVGGQIRGRGKVNLSSILTLSNDGPNVNKTIFRAVNTSLKGAGNPGMINIGTCNLPVVHNSFCKALEAYGTPVDDLAVDIHSFFKISSARREDFKFIQLEEAVETHTFLRHVPSRWLTLGPVVDRLIEQWEPLQKYFTDLANKDPKNAPTSSAFKRSCTRLQNQQTLVELHFLKSVMPLYHSFLELFQTEAPLVHVLYEELCRLVYMMMGRYVKASIYQNKTGQDLKEVKHGELQNQLSDKEMIIGDSTRQVLGNLDSGKQKRALLDIRKFFNTGVSYLLSNFPFDNELLKDLGCLHPEHRLKPSSSSAIERVARKLPFAEDVALITDEWKVYQGEEIDEKLWKIKKDDEVELRRIDHYWRDILKLKTGSGKDKYPRLGKVVKGVLALPHGNADVERGLSDNKKMLGKDRVKLSSKSIIGNRLSKEAVKIHDPEHMQPECVPLTKELIGYVRGSHRVYKERLEEEKQKREEEEKNRQQKKEEPAQLEKQKQEAAKEKESLNEKMKKLNDKEKNSKEELHAAEKLLEEGNEKLARALRKRDFSSASVSQSLIETAQKKIKESTERLDRVREEQKSVESRKRKNLEKIAQVDSKKAKK